MMSFKNIFLISIILLTIFTLSAVSAQDVVADDSAEIISGGSDLNTIDSANVNHENFVQEDILGESSVVESDDNTTNQVVIFYEGYTVENESDDNTTESSIESSDLVKYYRNDSQYEATFYDAEGTPLVNASIPIEINGAHYNRTTNSSGIMKFSINLNPGDYVIKVTNPATNEFALNNITVLSTLLSNDVVKSYKNGTQYYVTVLNGQGNPLAGANITLNINGVFYNRTTNGSGVARLNINLNSASKPYVITAQGPDGLMLSNNITVLPTITGKDIKKTYKNGTQYYANFTDSEGNPLANTNITFNINGVYYTRKTDANGTARLNINLEAGKYVLTAINPNTTEQMSNTVEVLSKIVVDGLSPNANKSLEYKSGYKYTVTLYNDDGSIAKNKNVQFNINGVVYNKKSDENGTAFLTINLNPGDYIITGDFEGCKVSNLLKIRVTPTVKLVSSEVKYGQPIQFYLHEKNSGNPITGEHYGILYFNGTTYGAYPDATGLVSIGQQLPVGFSDMFLFGTIDDGYYSSILNGNTIKIVE